MTTFASGFTILAPGPTSIVATSPGLPGPAGVGIQIDKVVGTYAELPTDLGLADDGFTVVVQADGLMYTWSGTAWPADGDGAPFKGDPGRGVAHIAIAESGEGLDFTMSDSTHEIVAVPAIQAAADSASDAADSATAAATSASNAHTSETNAATSATGAGNSASAASGSATNAANSASAASTSATNAANSATTAGTDATDAADSATAASGSASSASNSASAAATSATNAHTSETNASSSASNAHTSETNAAQSAADAAQSAQDAADTVSSGVPNADADTKGGIMLPGDVDGELGGTYDHPTVTGWDKKADLVGGKIPSSQIPAQATHETVVVANSAARLALTSDDVQVGDNCVQTGDPGKGTYTLQSADPSQPSSWVLLVAPTDAVSSVNGQTGVVNLGKGDIGLGNVNNTADADKPVSTAQQTALDGKVPTSRTITAGTGLSGGGDLTTSRTLAVQFGTTSATACAGNDARLSDTRTPTDGSVSTAKIAAGAVTTTEIADGTITTTDISATAAIAKAQLASAVQTSLGKADSALQATDLATAQLVAVNSQTGTTYTLVLTDQNKAVECSNASAITLTIPPNSSVAFPVGTVIEVLQVGTGAITLAAGSGVTINGKTGTTAQWGVVVLRKRATDTWLSA